MNRQQRFREFCRDAQKELSRERERLRHIALRREAKHGKDDPEAKHVRLLMDVLHDDIMRLR